MPSKRFNIEALLLGTTSGALVTATAFAAASNDSLTAAIRADNDVAAKLPLRVSIANGEADVYTSINNKAASLEKDCKITAALIAKTVVKSDSSITIVRAWFYEQKSNTYREVEVHLGDVASFSSGSISEEQLLKSLRLTVVQAAGSHIKHHPEVVLSSNMDLFDRDGLRFYHPFDWVFHPIDNKWFIGQGQLDHNENGIWTALQMHKYDKCEDLSTAASWDAEWWRNHGINVLSRRMSKVGRENYDALFIECLDTAGPNRCQMHVYFGNKEVGIYGFQLLFDQTQRRQMLDHLQTMLETVRLGR